MPSHSITLYRLELVGRREARGPWRPPALLIRCLAAVCVLAASWAPARSQLATGPCDPVLEAPRDHPYGYRLRADRCEGVYVQDLSSTFRISSFTSVFQEFDRTSGVPLEVSWPVIGGSSIHLRAQGLRGSNYRMDTVQPVRRMAFTWPLEVVAGLGIGKPDIGVLGWIESRVGARAPPLYLPLRVAQRGHDPPTPEYELIVVPDRDLTEVYLTLARIDDQARTSEALIDGRPLRYGHYPALRPLRVAIPRPAEAGQYLIQLGGLLSRGGVTTVELRFIHATER